MKTVAILAACLLSGLVTLAFSAQDQIKIPEGRRTTLELYVTAQKAFEMWKAAPDDVVLIDVRTPEEFIFVGHPEMAQNIPGWFVEYRWDASKKEPALKANPSFIDEVSKYAKHDQTMLLMCRSGARSTKAVDLLAKAGFKKAYNVIDGFEGEKEENPKSPNYGKRTVNGWKNSGAPWGYTLDPERLFLE